MSEPETRSAKPAIFLTIFGLAAIAGVISMPFLAGAPAADTLSQWERFLGRFHPVVLHLPIGILALVILLEFGKLFKKDKGASTLVPVFFASVTSIVAVIFGFLLYQSNPGDYPEELVESHLWWGIGFCAAVIGCTVLKAWIDFAGGANNWVYFLALVGSGGAMGVASHDGGSITHGKTYLTDEAPPEVRELLGLPVEEGPPPPPPVEDQIVYQHIIQPILDQKCVSCHGEEKQKGKFRMDSYEALLAGGKEGEGFEPGNAEDSNIVFRIHLPLDDDEHMPPEGKKQMEDHEIAILEWWIDGGASPDLKLADAKMTDEIKEAMTKLVPPEVLAQQAAAAAAAQKAEEEARQALAAKVTELQQAFPSALNFESQQSSGLTFTAVSVRKDFGDEQLAKLAELSPSLVSVDLSGTAVTDEGLKSLAGASTLRMLRLSETAVTDASLETVAGMVALESLNLYGTQVTTEGVLKLADLPNLKRLYLWQTGVDAAGADLLREQFPECEIVLGIEVGGK
jgi:hypothetical protein